MIRVFSHDLTPRRTPSSNVHVFYNSPYSAQVALDIFYPLFGSDYRYEDLFQMVTTANHIFCAYDYTTRRYVACALVNNAGEKGGLYINLFGVRQSSQHHGVGTQLLKEILRWARYTRHTFVYLHVNASNKKAIGLYEKVGFKKQEYLPNYYQNSPKENPAGYRMVLVFS